MREPDAMEGQQPREDRTPDPALLAEIERDEWMDWADELVGPLHTPETQREVIADQIARLTRERDEARAANALALEWGRTLEAERDEARGAIGAARYCLDVDAGPTAVRAALDGMGLDDGIRAEYESDLDRVTRERDEALAEVERLHLALRNVRACAARMQRRIAKDLPLDVHEEAGHLLRFCAEVGVVAEILRGDLTSAGAEGADHG